jgi:hypothetical protein
MKTDCERDSTKLGCTRIYVSRQIVVFKRHETVTPKPKQNTLQKRSKNTNIGHIRNIKESMTSPTGSKQVIPYKILGILLPSSSFSFHQNVQLCLYVRMGTELKLSLIWNRKLSQICV